MQEASETQSWLEFCHACHYMDETLFMSLDKEYESIIGMLNRMEQQADKFCYSYFPLFLTSAFPNFESFRFQRG